MIFITGQLIIIIFFSTIILQKINTRLWLVSLNFFTKQFCNLHHIYQNIDSYVGYIKKIGFFFINIRKRRTGTRHGLVKLNALAHEECLMRGAVVPTVECIIITLNPKKFPLITFMHIFLQLTNKGTCLNDFDRPFNQFNLKFKNNEFIIFLPVYII